MAPRNPKAGASALASQKENLPATIGAIDIDTFADHDGAGLESVRADDIVMPRLSILQDLSPAVQKRKPEYIEGAEPGMIINVATRDLMQSVNVIPCFYRRHHLEWKPNRGGFVADHGEDPSIMDQTHRNATNYDELPDGNLIVPTGTWYCIDIDHDGAQCIIAMPRTQMNASKQWNALATSEKITHPTRGRFTPPLFFRSYHLSTVVRDKDDNSWSVWKVERGPSFADIIDGKPALDPQYYQDAIRFYELIHTNELKVSAESFRSEEDGEQNSGDGGGDGGKF